MTTIDTAAFTRRLGLAHAGAPLETARLCVVTLHGRGADAAGILPLGEAIGLGDVAYLAPEAAGGAWYPNRFMEPLEANEPFLGRALARVGQVLEALKESGFGPARTALMGFSQGACLALESVARRPGSVASVAALSGGLIGPSVSGRLETGRHDGLDVFLGCSLMDPHIPAVRVRESAAFLGERGADVTMRLYPEPGHTVNGDEIAAVRSLFS